MPEILDVPFGGLSGLLNPNRVPFQNAITATDCFLDDDTITGRSGYRSVTPEQIDSTGNPQFLGRFQPTLALPAHTVVVISGGIWLITDPSSETASDGVPTLLMAGVFGAEDNISGAQEGTNYYLATDNEVPKWVRITSALTLDTLQQLPTAALPGFTLSSLSFVNFPVYTSHWTFAGGLSGSTPGIGAWTQIAGTIGGTATTDLTLGGASPAQDWSNTKWLLVVCSPQPQNEGAGQFKISLGNAANTFVDIQTIYDTPGADSPFCVYVLLSGIDKTVLEDVTQMRFTQLGPSTGAFSVLGYMAIDTPPEPGTVSYYVTYFNSVTGAESSLSLATNVVYNNNLVNYPQYHAARWHFGSFVDAGTASTNPDTLSFSSSFNQGAGLQSPVSTDFAPVYTFNGTIPTGAQFPDADTVRLYRSTPNGTSLVGSSVYSTDGTAVNAKRADGSAWTTGTGTFSDLPSNVSYWQATGTTWSITDNTGASASANLIYEAGGPGPRTTAMCSFGARLIAAYGNRVYVSSFAPVTASSNLVPEWPPIAIQDSDGWSFDIDPSPIEQILSLVAGDAVYICTNKRVLVLRDLTPGTVPFDVLNRGVLGRQAACYAEESLFWASYDGVYSAQNVSQTAELSQPIRVYVYQDQFNPNGAVAIGYQLRKLHVFNGNKRIRFDFVTQKWTGPDTLANDVVFVLSFVNYSPISLPCGSAPPPFPPLTPCDTTYTFDDPIDYSSTIPGEDVDFIESASSGSGHEWTIAGFSGLITRPTSFGGGCFAGLASGVPTGRSTAASGPSPIDIIGYMQADLTFLGWVDDPGATFMSAGIFAASSWSVDVIRDDVNHIFFARSSIGGDSSHFDIADNATIKLTVVTDDVYQTIYINEVEILRYAHGGISIGTGGLQVTGNPTGDGEPATQGFIASNYLWNYCVTTPITSVDPTFIGSSVSVPSPEWTGGTPVTSNSLLTDLIEYWSPVSGVWTGRHAGNDGTFGNAPSVVSDGGVPGGFAVVFSLASLQYATVPDFGAIDALSDFTISVRANITTASSGFPYVPYLMSKFQVSASSPRPDPFGFFINPSFLWGYVDDQNRGLEISTAVVTSAWQYLTVTYDATTGIAEFFVDAVSQGTQTGFIAGGVDMGVADLYWATFNGSFGPADANACFDGKISDSQAWGRVLTPTEIGQAVSLDYSGYA